MMLLAHLWQSTLCAALAALLAASLPRARARARHRIWLLPRSSSWCRSRCSFPPVAPRQLAACGDRIIRLDRRSLARSGAAVLEPPGLQLPGSGGGASDVARVFALALVFVWAAGAIGLVWWRTRAWLSLSVLARAGTPLESGREAEALRRAQRHWPLTPTDCAARVRCQRRARRAWRARPQVLWPAGLSDSLNDTELEVILAHEVCHVRWRDNAVAILQAVVESVFWFHPVVWRLSAQLVSERERACDEEVLQMGADKRKYAEGILKVCGFCLGSPVECRVGIGRSGLARRIVRIMEHRPSDPLPTSLRAVLAGVGVLMVAAPLMTGVLAARTGQLDVPGSQCTLADVSRSADGLPCVRGAQAPKTGQRSSPNLHPRGDARRHQGRSITRCGGPR